MSVCLYAFHEMLFSYHILIGPHINNPQKYRLVSRPQAVLRALKRGKCSRCTVAG